MKHLSIVLILWLLSTASQGQPKKGLFCEIANGKRQENQIAYRDHSVVAFTSHGPVNPAELEAVAKKIREALTSF